MNYNKVMLGARLVRDPELRVTPKGTAICQFSVATSRRYKSDSGEQMEETSFIDCEAWGKTGELIQQHFTKGKAIFIDGRMKQDTWEDKETKAKRSKIKVVVESFQFVGAKEDGQTPAPAQQQTPKAASKPAAQDNLDEDVPF
jgi:single-strand DNA-binding protein